jgi:hypothetical protein
MYLDANIAEGVATEDAVALMNKYYDVTATYRTYEQTQQAGEEALCDLQAALAEGNAAMVTYPVAIVWTGADVGFTPGPTNSYFRADHAAVVTEVDMEEGVVYVNDSSMTEDGESVGFGHPIPFGVFMAGWQVANYTLTIVAPKAPASVNADVSAA